MLDKEKFIQGKFAEIMLALGLDLNDESLKGTPERVAKMYCSEIFSGLDKNNMPTMTTFDSIGSHKEMIIQRNMEINSICEHHFLPIMGKCHLAYIPGNKIVGLSKMNRLVRYIASRPQVQERLTCEIAESFNNNIPNCKGVAVMVEADHLCVKMRGVMDSMPTTVTNSFIGDFRFHPCLRQEFFAKIKG